MHRFLLVYCLFYLFTTIDAIAQTDSNAISSEEINPIIRTLDSLDNIDPVYRYKNILIGDKLNKDSVESTSVPTFTQEEYKQKIQTIVSPIRIDFNQTINNYINVYAKHARKHTSKIIGLSDMYFPMIEELLDREGLPLELKYLAIVESALNPNAVSRSGATGIWQFMYNTGKAYDLHIDSYIDERRDPYKSTLAAIEYFKDMYRIYGDWHLVIASYNCGPGNVNKAIRRSGGETNFWKMQQHLPRETRGYLPAFMAVTYLFNHLEDHNLFVTEAPYTHFELDTVMLSNSISFKSISDAIGLPIEIISYLNPSYKRDIIPNTEWNNKLVLPTEQMATFDSKRSELLAKEDAAIIIYAKQKINYRVKSGDNLSLIASRNKCSVRDLKEWNNLRSTKLRIGQNLIVYALVASDSKSSGKNNNQTKDNNNYLYYTVQEGDTLWDIAKRYNDVSVQQLLQINNIGNHRRLRPGTKIKIKSSS